MSPVSTTQSIGSFVVERPSRSKVFEGFGLDYCCGGHLSLEEACAKIGVEPALVLRALAQFDAASPADEAAPGRRTSPPWRTTSRPRITATCIGNFRACAGSWRRWPRPMVRPIPD